jgi:hypothetical protein
MLMMISFNKTKFAHREFGMELQSSPSEILAIRVTHD